MSFRHFSLSMFYGKTKWNILKILINKNIFKRHKHPSLNVSSIKYFKTLTSRNGVGDWGINKPPLGNFKKTTCPKTWLELDFFPLCLVYMIHLTIVFLYSQWSRHLSLFLEFWNSNFLIAVIPWYHFPSLNCVIKLSFSTCISWKCPLSGKKTSRKIEKHS